MASAFLEVVLHVDSGAVGVRRKDELALVAERNLARLLAHEVLSPPVALALAAVARRADGDALHKDEPARAEREHVVAQPLGGEVPVSLLAVEAPRGLVRLVGETGTAWMGPRRDGAGGSSVGQPTQTPLSVCSHKTLVASELDRCNTYLPRVFARSLPRWPAEQGRAMMRTANDVPLITKCVCQVAPAFFDDLLREVLIVPKALPRPSGGRQAVCSEDEHHVMVGRRPGKLPEHIEVLLAYQLRVERVAEARRGNLVVDEHGLVREQQAHRVEAVAAHKLKIEGHRVGVKPLHNLCPILTAKPVDALSTRDGRSHEVKGKT
eukprot:6173184-Pleurochrysis_carterae.AAC.4